MGRRTILLISALVIAVIGASLVFLYVQGVDQRAQAEAQPVQVLTATETIEAGERVSDAEAAGKFALQDVPGTALLDGALVSTDRIADKVAMTTMYPGEQVIESKFGEVGSQQQITIPDKALAVSLELTDPQRVAGFVSPGAEVAIFASVGTACQTQASADQATDPYTRLLLNKVPVIGVGQTGFAATPADPTATADETVEQVPTTILTVGLDQRDSERVILASQTSCLSLGLRTENSVVKPSGGVGFDSLFGKG